MKKMWMVVVVITTFVVVCGCQEGLLTTGNAKILTKLQDDQVKNTFVGEWELIELTGGIGGNKWNFESPSPNTLKVLKLDDGLSFTYTRKTYDNFSRIETMEYVFVEEISMFDGKKHIMLGEKSSIDEKVYLTILFEFRENGNYMVLDDNAYDGFRSVYKRIR